MDIHRTLWNEDILREIFSHLATPTTSTTEPHDGRVALARCARSSKAFFEPAVDFLWRELDSLSVLLRLPSLAPPPPPCLPSEDSEGLRVSEGRQEPLHDDNQELTVVRISHIHWPLLQLTEYPRPGLQSEEREEEGASEDSRKPDHSDGYCSGVTAIARVRFYARRIRKLVHHSSPREDVRAAQTATLATLHHQLRGEPLFPKLTALYWAQQSAHDVLDILTLVSPALRQLHISQTASPRQDGRHSAVASSGTQSSAWCTLIHELSEAAPALETLTLSGNFDASSILCVGELKQLRTLTIVNLAQRGFSAGYLSILRSCAALSHLRDFGIKLAVSGSPGGPDGVSALEDDGLSELVRDEAGFHSLRSLRVHGSLSLVSRFLSHVASPSLVSFDVMLPLPGRWEDFRACFDALALRFASSLRVVRLSGSWRGDLSSVACPMVVLGSLLHLPHLEELAVISHTGVARALAPADVAAMAKAWPHLRSLKLLYQPVGKPLPIDALAAFAAHCPALHTLWLASVDVRGAEGRELEGCPQSDHGLVTIWLSGMVASASDVSHWQAARFIDRMFPRVDPRPVELPWHPCRDEPGWERVLHCLREVKAARMAVAAAAA
ncbi:hypothetical protein PYCCODRAFT_20328 [Trametes coccinea BRFM310]|uniref:F-box domain-containing protein n=1 Tax=Trametes coccinea (strain BRFM310) TaxID=1353009 RepID=A0A1Y2J4T8_TRAC3|nr:hypothetical protein PYCCODRAFT_20328 [Trametes coccinea BRFM310]